MDVRFSSTVEDKSIATVSFFSLLRGFVIVFLQKSIYSCDFNSSKGEGTGSIFKEKVSIINEAEVSSYYKTNYI